jgi:hypothetical protein
MEAVNCVEERDVLFQIDLLEQIGEDITRQTNLN